MTQGHVFIRDRRLLAIAAPSDTKSRQEWAEQGVAGAASGGTAGERKHGGLHGEGRTRTSLGLAAKTCCAITCCCPVAGAGPAILENRLPEEGACTHDRNMSKLGQACTVSKHCHANTGDMERNTEGHLAINYPRRPESETP